MVEEDGTGIVAVDLVRDEETLGVDELPGSSVGE